MKRLLLAASVLASVAVAGPAANACTVETCPGTSLACADLVYCHVCYYEPPGAMRCIV